MIKVSRWTLMPRRYLLLLCMLKTVLIRKKSDFAFKPHMNDVNVKSFNEQFFNQDSDESATLKIKCINPPDLIFQLIPVKEKVKNIEVNRMRKGYIVETSTSVDIQKVVKIGGKVIHIYEGAMYRKDFKISPFREVIEKFFALTQKYKNERNYLMQNLVILIMNSLYAAQNQKKFTDIDICKSELYMQTAYDDIVLEYWKLPNGIFLVKL